MIVNMDIPRDIVHIILEYDGQIRHRTCKYIDVIPNTDPRRNMLDDVLIKKAEILENIEIDGGNFFIEVVFETHPYMGLSYDYQWSQSNKYEICFYNYKNNKTILKYKTLQ
jgi:hypothetical protein